MIYPDSPMPVSVDFLKRIDADPPGTWLAQPKLDGWRRVLVYEKGEWSQFAKHHSEGSDRTLPLALWDALKAWSPRDGTVFDAEWMGMRCKDVAGQRTHSLHVFDLLRFEGDWLRGTPFWLRYETLGRLLPAVEISGRGPEWQQRTIFQVRAYPNPGLVDFFQQQMQDPLSEGLVVRRADSKLILSTRACADNPMVFKCKYRGIKEKVRA